MKIIISCDHAGFEIKQSLIDYLAEKGHEVEDFGPLEYNSTDDYPDFIVPAMETLQNTDDSLGIIMCRNGVGVSMLANKFKSVRAALCFAKEQAKSARTDDNANVLAIPTDYLSKDETFELVEAFIDTPFSNLERHTKRLDKVVLTEEDNFKQ